MTKGSPVFMVRAIPLNVFSQLTDCSFERYSQRRETSTLSNFALYLFTLYFDANFWPPVRFLYSTGGTNKGAKYDRSLLAALNRWPNQLGRLTCDKVLSKPPSNTRFLTGTLLMQSLYPVPQILCRHWRSKTSKQQTSSVCKFHASQIYNRAERAASQ